MISVILRFLNLLIAGLVTGTMFGIWLGFNPTGLSAPSYLEQQQQMITSLNVVMPVLGLSTILLSTLTAFLQRRNKVTFYTLLTAAVLLMVSGIITRWGNQPINSMVMTWTTGEMPDNWPALRDKWWMLHLIRTGAAFLAFCLIISSNLPVLIRHKPYRL